MTLQTEAGTGRKGKKETRRQSIISERRQRISDSFSDQNESSDELKKSFDEWMKIVADNKINASNSWTLALIDYFHDLTLLREGDSINFQKASCTLDGCVKIYTSRVDSVDVETKKLLSGLQNYGNQQEVVGLVEDVEAGTTKAKKRGHRHTNMLEKDITNLDLRKLDIEFTVDPLFRKTSADFDEGGARGLLLNHLSISSNGQIIFDAGDISLNTSKPREEVSEMSWIDHEKLKGDLWISHVLDQFQSKLECLWDTEICSSLRNFEFSNPDNQICAEVDFTKEAEPNDFYDFSPNIDDNVSIGGDECDDCMYDGDIDQEQCFNEEGGETEIVSQEYLPAIGIQESVFSYFDTSVLRNWAGPEHWRSKPLSSARTEKSKVKKRVPKEVELINFLDPNPVDLKSLFSHRSSINLPKAEKLKSKHLIPEDLRISEKNVAKLFSNPEYKFNFKKKINVQRRNLHNQQNINVSDYLEQDDLFWAENEMIAPNEAVNNAADGDIPQGFEFDPYDDEDSGMDNEGETPEGPPGDISVFLDYGDQLVDQPKKVLAAPLRYAKTAKRIDVKRLKDNIWKELLEMNDESTELPNEATIEKPKKFTELVHGLDSFYPEHKRQDISVAFCFICVLHLANEQNLSIEGSDQLQELIISQNK